MSSIHFFTEGTTYKLEHPRKTSNWIKAAVRSEKSKLVELNYIFCSDAYLRNINVQFLNHTTLTDIITFDHADQPGEVTGEIYISIPRVRANARIFKTTFDKELHRVIIHGVLHLLGYSDKTERQKAAMRKKEDSYLSLR